MYFGLDTNLWASLMAQIVESTCNAGDLGLILGSGKSPENEMGTHSSILAWEIHGQRTLVFYGPWGRKELDTAQQLIT